MRLELERNSSSSEWELIFFQARAEHFFLCEEELTEEQKQNREKLSDVRDIFLEEIKTDISSSNGRKFVAVRYTENAHQINLVSNDFSENGGHITGDYLGIKLYPESDSMGEKLYEFNDSRNIKPILVSGSGLKEAIHDHLERRRNN